MPKVVNSFRLTVHRLRKTVYRPLSTVHHKGFTLIELLIVIAIIGLLVGLGTFSYGNAQAKARDTRRKQDLQAIASALHLYYQDNGAYPNFCDNSAAWFGTPWDFNACPGGNLPDVLQPYLKSLPYDPINIDTGNANLKLYEYVPSGGGTGYTLRTVLENKNDWQINCKVPPSTPGSCGWNDYYNYFITNPN